MNELKDSIVTIFSAVDDIKQKIIEAMIPFESKITNAKTPPITGAPGRVILFATSFMT